jgi:hypothetical protein
MSMYPVEELLNRWARQELSILQAIGQILQHLLRQEKEIQALKRRSSGSATPQA